MSRYKAEPLSNEIIIDITQDLRRCLRCKPDDALDIVAILEFAMPQLYEEFDYSIRNKEEMEVDSHAYIDAKKNQIVIRQDIYDRARSGMGRDRFTIAHEIGHYILHNSKMLLLTRVYSKDSVKPYEDVEWQADAFAGELLCPSCAIKEMEVVDIANKYGVSIDAAIVQKKKSIRYYSGEYNI